MTIPPREYFEKTLTEILKNQESVKESLARCPRGSLNRIRERNNTDRYVQACHENGKRRRQTIEKDQATFALLAHKEFLQEKLRILEKNEKGLKQLLSSYETCTPDHILEGLPPHIATMPISEYTFLTGKLRPDTDVVPWSESPYEQSTYLPQHKVHTTSRGLKVRSKSEVSIAEAMYKLGIQFRYEQVLRIGSKVCIPDFTIRRPDGSLLYYEHCGLPSNQAYWEHHKKKLEQYEQAGIYPWNNLIVTYDNENGELDLQYIEMLLRQKVFGA